MEIYDRGWRLKALRKKRGLSQKAVADRLGVDRAALYIDDLSESQQDTVRSIVETLRREFLKEES